MAQFAVFFVQAVPPVGTTAHAQVYRGDHADAPAAVQAAATVFDLSHNVKVWVTPVAQLTAYRVEVTANRNVVLE